MLKRKSDDLGLLLRDCIFTGKLANLDRIENGTRQENSGLKFIKEAMLKLESEDLNQLLWNCVTECRSERLDKKVLLEFLQVGSLKMEESAPEHFKEKFEAASTTLISFEDFIRFNISILGIGDAESVESFVSYIVADVNFVSKLLDAYYTPSVRSTYHVTTIDRLIALEQRAYCQFMVSGLLETYSGNDLNTMFNNKLTHITFQNMVDVLNLSRSEYRDQHHRMMNHFMNALTTELGSYIKAGKIGSFQKDANLQTQELCRVLWSYGCRQQDMPFQDETFGLFLQIATITSGIDLQQIKEVFLLPDNQKILHEILPLIKELCKGQPIESRASRLSTQESIGQLGEVVQLIDFEVLGTLTQLDDLQEQYQQYTKFLRLDSNQQKLCSEELEARKFHDGLGYVERNCPPSFLVLMLKRLEEHSKRVYVSDQLEKILIAHRRIQDTKNGLDEEPKKISKKEVASTKSTPRVSFFSLEAETPQAFVDNFFKVFAVDHLSSVSKESVFSDCVEKILNGTLGIKSGNEKIGFALLAKINRKINENHWLSPGALENLSSPIQLLKRFYIDAVDAGSGYSMDSRFPHARCRNGMTLDAKRVVMGVYNAKMLDYTGNLRCNDLRE